MGRISDVVPLLYYGDKNNVISFLESLDVEVSALEKAIQGITDLIDVDKCPDDKLPYLAALTGCPLSGITPASQRRMLRNWPWLLKIKGTNLSLEVYLNSIGAMDHRIPTYFRDETGDYVESKPQGQPFKAHGTWYNIRTHFFGIETTWNGVEYTRWQQWHEEFVENINWWLKRMKPFHAELLRWVTILRQDETLNLYHGGATIQGYFHKISMNRRWVGKVNFFCGNYIHRGMIIKIRSVR